MVCRLGGVVKPVETLYNTLAWVKAERINTMKNLPIILLTVAVLYASVAICEAQVPLTVAGGNAPLPTTSHNSLERFVARLIISGNDHRTLPNAQKLYHNSRSIAVYLRYVEMAQGGKLREEQIVTRLNALEADIQMNPNFWAQKQNDYTPHPNSGVRCSPDDVRFIFNSIYRQLPQDRSVFEHEKRAHDFFAEHVRTGEFRRLYHDEFERWRPEHQRPIQYP